ncbi:MAG TPA: flagellar basal-body MS-ring/collar protein FliF [Candidatus Deferrimicrobiaceae bacterium]|jgi:flagellar M-ring protein FliF
MADVNQAALQVKNVFASMPPAKRWTALGVGGATLVAMIALILWSQKPDFQVLFSGLSSEDAGKIVEKLKGSKVPYKLDAGGATILVPGERVYETRLQMAGEGMLQGGAIGFEIFDTPKLGMTDFVQKLNYQRAIQGELSRTIQSLASVEKARVHIVIAKKSIFSEQEENPSASVVLKLRSGRTLTENQVTAIAQLVSSSVPGLGTERVSVIDSAGTLLSKIRPTGDSAGSTEAMGVQRGLESSLEDRARAILEKTVGAGRVVVQVASDIEQKKVESTEEKYDPDSVVVRSEQRSAEKNSGSAGSSGGIPGTPSNVPNSQGQPSATATSSGGGASNSSSRSNETINYEVSRTVSKSSAPILAVKRLTIAVLVDGNYKSVKDAKGVETATYVPRTAEELASYERLVKNAVGFNQDRGDTFEIVTAPFQTEDNLPASVQAKSLPAIPTSYVSVAKYLASVLLLLVLVLLVVRPLIQWISTPAPLAPPTGDMYAYAVPGAPAGASAEGELPAGGRPPALSSGKDDIAALAQREPQRAAQAVKMWLVQG